MCYSGEEEGDWRAVGAHGRPGAGAARWRVATRRRTAAGVVVDRDLTRGPPGRRG